jgi:DNA repair exonuclease SbcCD nuclease subunit
VLLLADTHLGLDHALRPRVQRPRRGPDLLANTEAALAPARRGEVDLVVHGGDLLYRSKVPPALVQLAYEPLLQVADAGMPVVVVPGNHERSVIPYPLLVAHPRLHVLDRPRTIRLVLRGLRVDVVGFPCLRNGIRDRFRTLVAEAEAHVQAPEEPPARAQAQAPPHSLLPAAAEAAAEGDAMRRARAGNTSRTVTLDPADVRLLCLHQTVEGARVGIGTGAAPRSAAGAPGGNAGGAPGGNTAGAPRSNARVTRTPHRLAGSRQERANGPGARGGGAREHVFRGDADTIRGRDLPDGFAAVLAGHIHRHQVLTHDLAGRALPAPVLYPGAIERTSSAERLEQKGALLLQVAPDPSRGGRLLRWRLHPLPARPWHDLHLDPRGLSPGELETWLRRELSALPARALVRLWQLAPAEPQCRPLLALEHLRTLAGPDQIVERRFPFSREGG